MRELKFRVLAKNKQNWLYVTIPKGWLNNSTINTYDWETLGRYSGIKDKNGKEIYEGDILEDGAIVEWFDSLTWDSGGSKHSGFYCRKWFMYKDDGELTYHEDFSDDTLVIGNIHENKDLVQ